MNNVPNAAKLLELTQEETGIHCIVVTVNYACQKEQALTYTWVWYTRVLGKKMM